MSERLSEDKHYITQEETQELLAILALEAQDEK